MLSRLASRALAHNRESGTFIELQDQPRYQSASPIEGVANGASNIYSPLNESQRQIRLLRKLDTGGNRTIALEMKVKSLDDKRDFTALSYLWGVAEARNEILVNGQPFFVRPNLHDFLTRKIKTHRDVYPLLEPEWIFIDAICINQSDLAERSSQVALMGSVYREAALVIAWLGTIPDDFKRAWPSLLDPGMDKTTSVEHICGLDPQILKSEGMVLMLHKLFVLHEYWTRVWMVQELLLAHWLVFIRGPLQADADSLFTLFELLDTHHQPGLLRSLGPENVSGRLENGTTPRTDDAYNTILWPNWRAYSILKRWRAESSKGDGFSPCTVFDILSAFPGRMCSVEYDKIYGVLGLTDSVCKVDYQVPRLEIYLRILIEGVITRGSSGLADAKFLFADGLLALLNALNLRLEDPTTFMVTELALYFCGITNVNLKAITYRHSRISEIGSRFPIGGESYRKTRESILAGGLRQYAKLRLEFYDTNYFVKLPAAEGLGAKTANGWTHYVGAIARAVFGKLIEQRDARRVNEAGDEAGVEQAS